MYRLTLTKPERDAIDWVGGRYRHGTELYLLLWASSAQEPVADWDHDGPITFLVPEHVAWEAAEIIDEGLDCFGPELCHKLREFRSGIV